PVTYPGILTATIIGVAQALGETAPLLLIGMNAFVAQVPGTPLDQSSALPVQIFLWQGNENRNFFEARTFAAIIVLLGLMLTLNAIAIFLRSRLEKRASPRPPELSPRTCTCRPRRSSPNPTSTPCRPTPSALPTPTCCRPA